MLSLASNPENLLSVLLFLTAIANALTVELYRL